MNPQLITIKRFHYSSISSFSFEKKKVLSHIKRCYEALCDSKGIQKRCAGEGYSNQQ